MVVFNFFFIPLFFFFVKNVGGGDEIKSVYVLPSGNEDWLQCTCIVS